MKKLLATLMLLLAGCNTLPKDDGSRPVTVEFHADPQFKPAERAVLKAAADEWRDATGGLANVTLTYDASDKLCETKNCLHRLTSDDERVIEADFEACMGLYPCILGWTTHTVKEKVDEPIEIDVVVDRWDDAAYGTKVVAHEMGHALGVKHIPYSHALMYPGSNPRQLGCITQADVSEYCKVNHCGTHKVNPCD